MSADAERGSLRPSFYLRTMLRESRGQRRRLLFFVACLAVGVAAVVAVAGLAASLDSAIRGEARQLLAADLRIAGRRPIPPEVDALLDGIDGVRRALVIEMATVVAAPPPDGATGEPTTGEAGASRLVELKAVADGYPFYGDLELAPARPLAELLGAEGTVVAPELLASLGLAVGDELRIGGEAFRIAGTVLSEPDRMQAMFSIGPRVFLSSAGLERSGLGERQGSQVRYRELIALPESQAAIPGRLAELKEELKATLDRLDGFPYRVESYQDAQPGLRRSLDRTERFLGLVALLSLLAGGIGVAQTVRAWLAGRLDSIAILKCLGMRPRQILLLYLGQTAGLGLLGSAVGVLAGSLLQLAVPQIMGQLVPAEAIAPWQPAAIARGFALGLGVALLFSLPPLAGILQVPPSRVLRRDAEGLAAAPWVRRATFAALALGLLLLATVQSGSLLLGLGFLAGLGAVAAALAGAALLLTRRLVPRAVAGMPEGASRLWLRHGVAALARPGAGTLGAIVALGLGVLVVLGMALVEAQLSEQLEADLPARAPSFFLIDIQPQQWPGVRELLVAEGASELASVPVVTARLSEIDGRDTAAMARDADEGSRRWALTREQRLTYAAELPEDNKVIAGALWSLPDAPEVSVEEEFARELEVEVGSRLTLDIQGVPVTLTVSSLRSVVWESMGFNFFLVVEPGVLEEAPQQRIATARFPADAEQLVQDRLVARFPNVTPINIRRILEKVVAVLERVGLGIRLLGGFTVLAAIAILAGAVSASAARRGREVALLKTLGLTRAGVASIFSVEYALVGLVAGAIGAVGGTGLAWAVATQGMELDWSFRPLHLAAAVAGSVALAVGAGMLVSAGALRRRPNEVLRGE